MRRWLVRIALALAVLTSLALGLTVLCRFMVLAAPMDGYYYQEQLSRTPGGYRCIVVPGAGIQGTHPGIYLRDRLDTALALYQAGASDTILLSGALNPVFRIHETAVMAAYLKERGVPASALVVDEWGEDTAETVRRCAAFAEGDRIIFCTQSLYAPRAQYLAQRFGLAMDVAESDVHIYTDGVGKNRLRETLACVKAVWEGLFAPTGAHPVQSFPLKGGEGDA